MCFSIECKENMIALLIKYSRAALNPSIMWLLPFAYLIHPISSHKLQYNDETR